MCYMCWRCTIIFYIFLWFFRLFYDWFRLKFIAVCLHWVYQPLYFLSTIFWFGNFYMFRLFLLFFLFFFSLFEILNKIIRIAPTNTGFYKLLMPIETDMLMIVFKLTFAYLTFFSIGFWLQYFYTAIFCSDFCLFFFFSKFL